MTEVTVAVLAIVGFGVAAAEAAVLTALGWLLSWTAIHKLGHERRIAELEAEVKRLVAGQDVLDKVVDSTLEVMGTSRNGAMRGRQKEGPDV